MPRYAGHSLRSGWPPPRPWRTCPSGRSWPRPPQVLANGPPLHSRWFSVQKQRRRGRWSVNE
jgi:hypothetical protein